MELKDFLKASFTEICLAIEEANLELKDSSAVINPKVVRVNSENSKSYGREDEGEKFGKNRVVHKVDFDVAVNAAKDEATGKSGKNFYCFIWYWRHKRLQQVKFFCLETVVFNSDYLS